MLREEKSVQVDVCRPQICFSLPFLCIKYTCSYEYTLEDDLSKSRRVYKIVQKLLILST